MPYSWSFALTSCSLILGLVGTLTDEEAMVEEARRGRSRYEQWGVYAVGERGWYGVLLVVVVAKESTVLRISGLGYKD